MSFEERPPTTTVRIGLPVRARLAFAALAAVFGLILAVGLLGPSSPRVVLPTEAANTLLAPASAPVAPSRAPATAPTPIAEHLPQLERHGRDAPTGSLLLLAEASREPGSGIAHRVLDLRIGRLGPPLTSDPIVPLADGDFLCACVDRPWAASTEQASIRAIRLSARGDTGEASGSLDFEGFAAAPDGPQGLAFSTAFGPKGESVAVVAAERDVSGTWQVSVGLVGFDRGLPVRLELGRIADETLLTVSPSQPAVAPDGRTIAIHVDVFRMTDDGDGVQAGTTWLVPLRGSRLGRAQPLEEQTEPGTFLQWAAFTAPDRYAEVVTAAEGTVGWDVRTYDLEGRLLSAAPLEPAPRRPTFAAGGGAIMVWDGFAHVAYRVDASGAVTTRSADSLVSSDPGAWRPVERIGPQPPMATAPSGDRLYGVGYRLGTEDDTVVPTGIWVLGAGDGELDVLDRWTAEGQPTSMAVSPDGRWLFVAAAAGISSDGRPSTRHASVAAYDTTTGDRALLAGRLGTGFLELARGP